MIEVVAAISAASISILAMCVGNFSKKTSESRDAVIRLTESVNTVAIRLDEIHTDLKTDSREMFRRLNSCEQRLVRLETGAIIRFNRRASDPPVEEN